LSKLAIANHLTIVGGTTPTRDDANEDVIYNDCYLFGPSGATGVQGKLHMTRFENEEWNVSPRSHLNVFDSTCGRVAVAICYDVEFPLIARAAALAGAHILIVPSSTDNRQGFLRVRYCAHARAVENQMYVVHASTVGSLPMVPAVSLNYGQAAILSPSDFAFPRDGIVAEGLTNQEAMVIGELDMNIILDARTSGTVLPLQDAKRTEELTMRVDVKPL
jgi:predicted amidohydrolase